MSDPVKEKGERPNEETGPVVGETVEKSENPHCERQTDGVSGKDGRMKEAALMDGSSTKQEEEGEGLESDHNDGSEADSHSQHSHDSDDHPISRTSTTQSRTLIVVPRSKRRGLFARFSIVPEVEIPYNYKNSTKWFITATVAVAGAAAPFGSSVFYRMRPESPFPSCNACANTP